MVWGRCLILVMGLAMADEAIPKDESKVIADLVPVAVPGACDYAVNVNGKKIFVYNSRVAAFASFAFSGTVDVEITPLASAQSIEVRPLSYGIEPEQNGNTFRFTLKKPLHLSIEINGNSERPLFLFANPLEEGIPKASAPNVRFYKAGEIHDAGVVELKDNDTVYIEGGAVVRGAFVARGAKNVRIMGRGIIDGSNFAKGQRRMIQLDGCTDVTVRGITMLNSGHWTLVLDKCNGVKVENLKIICWRDWDDGIDICGSRNVTIDGCFIRTKDDCVAIKSVNYNWDEDWPVNSVDHDSRNITVSNSVLWNGVWGNALEIGFETRADVFTDITFRNIDIINVQGNEGALSINNGDRAVISNVLYEDIRIERLSTHLFDMKILRSRYSKDTERGRIRNVTFRNITVEGRRFPPSIIQGFDDDHLVEDVRFENVTINGKPIKSLEDGKFANSHSRNIKFR